MVERHLTEGFEDGHKWGVTKHAGFGCLICLDSYWDWSRLRLRELEKEVEDLKIKLQSKMSESNMPAVLDG